MGGAHKVKRLTRMGECLRVRACTWVRARTCVRACVCVCVRVCVNNTRACLWQATQASAGPEMTFNWLVFASTPNRKANVASMLCRSSLLLYSATIASR